MTRGKYTFKSSKLQNMAGNGILKNKYINLAVHRRPNVPLRARRQVCRGN